MPNTTNAVRSRLRIERKRRGLSQVALAAHARCSINTVSLAERGGFLTRAMAERFARVLGVEVQNLLEGLPVCSSDAPAQDQT